MSSYVTTDASATTSYLLQLTKDAQYVCKCLSTGNMEQLGRKRAAEISPSALYGQVRLEASMLTVGVDIAAAVMNLHM